MKQQLKIFKEINEQKYDLRKIVFIGDIKHAFGYESEEKDEFQEVLTHLGIQFVPSKRRHPQTNGKNEKFFH